MNDIIKIFAGEVCMFGIRFLKSTPTAYIMHYAGGRLKREGAGLSFFYYAPASVIVYVSVFRTVLAPLCIAGRHFFLGCFRPRLPGAGHFSFAGSVAQPHPLGTRPPPLTEVDGIGGGSVADHAV